MDRSHHPVLAVVSHCYSEPKGRFPRVTHPCATRPEGLVRLACVRHAASVRSEPESNSQVDDRPSAPSGKPHDIQGRLQGAVPALHIYCGYVTDMLSHSRQENPTCMNSMERLSFNQSSGALNSPVTGAAAHMSLHLNQQCQRADASPFPLNRGNRVTDRLETQARWATTLPRW